MIVNDNVLDKLLDRIRKIIYISKFDFNKIKVDADDKLPNDIIENENMMVLITQIIKDDGKCYPQMFLQETLYDEQRMVDSNKKKFCLMLI